MLIIYLPLSRSTEGYGTDDTTVKPV